VALSPSNATTVAKHENDAIKDCRSFIILFLFDAVIE
jgi:hypothetical protein